MILFHSEENWNIDSPLERRSSVSSNSDLEDDGDSTDMEDTSASLR